MTRYARAVGSKASNARLPADPTPWSEMAPAKATKRQAESVDEVATPKKKEAKVVQMKSGTPKTPMVQSPSQLMSPPTSTKKLARKTPLKVRAALNSSVMNTPTTDSLSTPTAPGTDPSPLQTRSARKKRAELAAATPVKGETPLKTVATRNLNTKSPAPKKITSKKAKPAKEEDEELCLKLEEDGMDSDDLDSDDDDDNANGQDREVDEAAIEKLLSEAKNAKTHLTQVKKTELSSPKPASGAEPRTPSKGILKTRTPRKASAAVEDVATPAEPAKTPKKTKIIEEAATPGKGAKSTPARKGRTAKIEPVEPAVATTETVPVVDAAPETEAVPVADAAPETEAVPVAEPAPEPKTPEVSPKTPAKDVKASAKKNKKNKTPVKEVKSADAPAEVVAPVEEAKSTDAPAVEVKSTDAPAVEVKSTDAPAVEGKPTDAPAKEVKSVEAPADKTKEPEAEKGSAAVNPPAKKKKKAKNQVEKAPVTKSPVKLNLKTPTKLIEMDSIENADQGETKEQKWNPVDKISVSRANEERFNQIREKLLQSGKPAEQVETEMKKIRRSMLKRLSNTRCLRCRHRGHMQKDCPQPAKKHVAKCYKCGVSDHISKNCSIKEEVYKFAECYVCKEVGHLTNTCPQNVNGIYPRGGSCYKCNEKTHLARNCPKVFKDSQNENVEPKEKTVLVGTLDNKLSGDADIADVKPNVAAKKGKRKSVVKF